MEEQIAGNIGSELLYTLYFKKLEVLLRREEELSVEGLLQKIPHISY